MDSFCPPHVEELVKHHDSLPPWEQKLVAAQNVLFNQELFSQVCHTAKLLRNTLTLGILMLHSLLERRSIRRLHCNMRSFPTESLSL